VDQDHTPVARLRWAMMNHYSLSMWQVYLSHFEQPTAQDWEAWLPRQEDENFSLLAYLRYIVVEVVAPTTTVGVVKWMDAVVCQILNSLYDAGHPTGNTKDWQQWIRESIIVFVHNASVLDGKIENPQLYYRGAHSGPEELDEPVWITKSFPLSRAPVGRIDLCVSSREMNDLLERATVHWLVVTEQAELELPIQHYTMSFCMELEKEYFGGLHVVEKGDLERDPRMIQVNLNLMVELTLERGADGHPVIKKVQKVVRMPDHVCVMDNLMETPHLLKEIRSSNCLLFLGAGFSFPARLPGWTNLLVEAAKKAAGFVKQTKPYNLSATVSIESEKRDNNQVSIMVKKRSQPHGKETVEVLTQILVQKEKIISMSEEVQQLVVEAKLENLEMAAQLLEDSLGDVLKWMLKGMLEMSQDGQFLNGEYILRHSQSYKQMAARLMMVKHLPVSGILTTNYDQLLCFCGEVQRVKNPCSVAKGVTPQTKNKKPQYLNMIRNREVKDSTSTETTDTDSRPVIQIHGSTSDPQSIVLTREGYRSLLHLNPAYSNFLKTVMARSTLLYMGFSFTDGYFNEIRSELMTLQEKTGDDSTQPFSYAVIDGKPQPVRDFFTHHEGVHLFSWQALKYGFGVMDRYLECLLRCTHLAAALSQCKVLLFNPQTSPLFLCDGQQVAVVDQQDLLEEYLPDGWSGPEVTGRVMKWDGVHDKPVEDYLLVTLKEPLDQPRKHEMVFRTLLGNSATGRPFFIPRRYVQVVGNEGEIQEDMEVFVSVEMLRNHKGGRVNYNLGLNLDYIQYLVPFGLRVLDTRCYLIQLNSTKELRLVPHKLLRLDKLEHTEEKASSGGPTSSLRDLKSIARKVAEDAVGQNNFNPVTWANNIQELLHLVQADSLAMNTKAMDHTMETIAEILEKQERHSLYRESAENAALRNHFQRFTLRSNITALALLTSELALTNCIKTFIIINAANITTVPRAHIDMFRHLYDSTSQYIHWAYPPRVIIHVGDSNVVQPKYQAVFSEYCLWTAWVSYHATVAAVLEEIQKPVSSKSTNLPVVFRGRGFFKTSNYPEFPETVQFSKESHHEESKWPLLPFHTLSLAHVNGRQQDAMLSEAARCSFADGRTPSGTAVERYS